ncbi:hypothetical protein HELRODRAFT_175871 [Helobdella robusta]|uniref:EGF-like domain-containing protein n=1 Tax=Helobdella robusta TaxID=6412 RepID=T1F9T1_HELRO|nr:hypothetical protein HELRODRAFT_175871 [Helobdella robusta]ESO00440.1 hypothetical protein HELRODRAFT_175871 [Helobdella robusta]
MDGRKKLSGAEYRRIAKEKRKKESDVLSLTPKLETLFNKSNVNRPRMKRKMADELCNDEALTNVENMYQVTMLEIIDRVITELSDRFESLNNVNSMFGFLSGVKIKEMQTADLKIKAENLANIYSADLNIDEFMFEIESFKHHALTVDKKIITRPKPNQLKQTFFHWPQQPLQLGGIYNMNMKPTFKGFKGCLRNVMFNEILYDLHTEPTLRLFSNVVDGCPQDHRQCKQIFMDNENIKKEKNNICGPNSFCDRSQDEYACVCEPGWSGGSCSEATPAVDYLDDSYIEWIVLDHVHELFASTQYRYETRIQLMFKTRHDRGLLLKVQNKNKSKYLSIEILSKKIILKYNFGGTKRKILSLPYIDVDDGRWHNVNVIRAGGWVRLAFDSFTGFYNNESYTSDEAMSPFFIVSVISGGVPKIIYSRNKSFVDDPGNIIVDSDFKNGKNHFTYYNFSCFI